MEVLLRFDTLTNDPATIDPTTHSASLKTLTLTETIAAPIVVNSTALITNLNAQFLSSAQLNDIGGPSNNVVWSSQQIYDFVVDFMNQIDWQQSVLGMTVTIPPPTPTDKDRYIVPAGATGAWAGRTNQIAQYNAAIPAWAYTAPNKGFAAYVEDQDKIYIYNGVSWNVLPGVGNHGSLGGLLGDVDPAASGHWHLSFNQLASVKKAIVSVGATKIDHSLLENLNGGIIGQYYHLSNAQHTGLVTGIDAGVLHNHNGAYYTKSEIDTQMGGKSDTGHSHNFKNLLDTPISYTGNDGKVLVVDESLYGGTGGIAFTSSTDEKVLADYSDGSPGRLVDKIDGVTLVVLPDGFHQMSVAAGVFALDGHTHTIYYTKTELNTSGGGGHVHWDNVDAKPFLYPPTTHDHNNLYYTESEIDTALSGKSDTGHLHSFISLTDTTPLNYIGQAGKSVIVNVGETGLEFGDATVISDFIDLGDVPTSYTGHGGDAVFVKAGEDGLEFASISGTDELVKLYSGDTSDFLATKLDNDTIKANFVSNKIYANIAMNGLTNVQAEFPNEDDILVYVGDPHNRWENMNFREVINAGYQKVVYVDPSNPSVYENGSLTAPWKDLSGAINHSSSGDIISLAPGIYIGDFVIPSNVSLQGEGLHRTFIVGNLTFSGGAGVFRDITHSGGTITSNATLSVYAVYSTGNVVLAAGDLTSNDFTIISDAGIPLTINSMNSIISFMNCSIEAPDDEKAIHMASPTGGMLNLSSVNVKGSTGLSALVDIISGTFFFTSGTAINLGGGNSISLANTYPNTKNALVDVIYYGSIDNTASANTIVDNLQPLLGHGSHTYGGAGLTQRQMASMFDNDSTVTGTTIKDALDNLKSASDGNASDIVDINTDLGTKYDKDDTSSFTDGNVVVFDALGDLQDGGDLASNISTLESEIFSVYVKNDSEPISIGDVVAINGSSEVTKARASISSDPFRVLGFATAIDGNNVTVRKFGKGGVTALEGGGSFSGSNNNIYLSATSFGKMTETAPTASGQIVVKLGFTLSTTEMEIRLADYAIIGS